ncbi:WxL domain-containing protein [Vagococcus sp. BWB3-3]|uniref:WxL domain-containing protein n=1 Tax=Vagococcus allomyrinae TaxID=2794353 RepID=A0A940SSM6_9ENTE|nr:WxL domain-containing protein [Vagococcus allomyrinae]MBP1039420.1 WxL domain-containing protein [Vagococcus allomyrinae]
MKKVTGLVSLCALALVVGPSALAANVGLPLDTKGSITFTDGDPSETGKIVKPNENDLDGSKEEVIDLDGKGTAGTGPLRIQFVPNFEFGTKAGFTSDAQVQNVQVIDYKLADGSASGKKIAPFVQVTNNTGNTAIRWTLSAKATTFQESDASGNPVSGGHILTGAHISLDGSTLTTTKGTTANAGALAAGQVAGTAIPTDGSTVVVLRSTGDTNGKQVSNVFHNGYSEAGTYATGDTAGVKFVKPAGESARASVNYKSTITWTLTDSL